MIAVVDLRVVLAGRPVLAGIDTAFAAGTVTAVLGPNGAGKSTLLACLAGLRVPSAGTVTIDGRDRAALDRRWLARHIGFLPQTADVHWDVDVATLVGLGRIPYHGRWGPSATDRAATQAAMATTDVARFATRPVGSLSGGERARVLLARVLAGSPAWLLADEPLANLDPAHQLDVLARLRAVAAGGAGVVVVLHDLNHAARVADAVVLLRDGRVVATGPTASTLTPAMIAATYDVAVEVVPSASGPVFVALH